MIVMAKLLRANFARLLKSVSFWVCFGSMIGTTVITYLLNYFLVADRPSEVILDSHFFQCSNILFFSSIFVPLFLGTDYSCGAVRNKMIVGRSRMEIYFSNLITVVCGSLLMIFGTWAAVFLVGLFTGGIVEMPADQFLLYAVVVFAAVIAMTSIYVILAMSITSKSTVSTLSIVFSVVMIIVASILADVLNQEENMFSWTVTEDGEVVPVEGEKNPLYLEGIKRDIVTVINDVLPSGQIVQIEMNQPHEPQMMPLYSVGVTAVITAWGAAAFRKKDIK